MNMQGFPRDFLLRLKPELEQGESGAIALSMGIRPPNSSEGGFLIMSPRSTDELGVVEIVRIELSATMLGSSVPPRPAQSLFVNLTARIGVLSNADIANRRERHNR